MADFVEDELKKLRAELAGMKEVQVITCHTSIVKVSIRWVSQFTAVLPCVREGFPDTSKCVRVSHLRGETCPMKQTKSSKVVGGISGHFVVWTLVAYVLGNGQQLVILEGICY